MRDKKWFIKELIRHEIGDYGNYYNSGYEDALAYTLVLAHQLDEPEKVVIPQFVADWILSHREKYDLYPALKRLEGNPFGWERIYTWYRMNTYQFVNTYLTGEYEVEGEQKYYVDLETAAYVAKWNGDNQVSIYTDAVFGSDEFEFHLTEIEIKNYDERFWPFAVEVAE